MLRAGTLNRRVEIQKRGPGVDGWGQPTPDAWIEHAKVWAGIRVSNGKEFAAAGGTSAQATASIRIRYRTDITAGMRVLHKSTVYEILMPLPDEIGLEYVDLACTTTMGGS